MRTKVSRMFQPIELSLSDNESDQSEVIELISLGDSK